MGAIATVRVATDVPPVISNWAAQAVAPCTTERIACSSVPEGVREGHVTSPTEPVLVPATTQALAVTGVRKDGTATSAPSDVARAVRTTSVMNKMDNVSAKKTGQVRSVTPVWREDGGKSVTQLAVVDALMENVP